MYCVLFNLLRRYKDQKIQIKLPDLLLNCLKQLNEFYDKKPSDIDISKILDALHSYLASISEDSKLKSDLIGMSVVKNFIKLLMRLQNISGEEVQKHLASHDV